MIYAYFLGFCLVFLFYSRFHLGFPITLVVISPLWLLWTVTISQTLLGFNDFKNLRCAVATVAIAIVSLSDETRDKTLECD